MTKSVPWRKRLSTGTEAVQEDVIRWYQRTKEGKAYVPNMIWGTLQTEAYATVILEQVVRFLGVPDDVPAGVAKRMERQRVLHEGEHHYDVILGEQALYTNIGGPTVMRSQIDRLLRDIDLPSLTLGIIPASARLAMFPAPAFGIYGEGDTVNVELISSELDITDESEVDLHHRMFDLLREGAAYGTEAVSLLRQAQSFWAKSPLTE
ncbi:MULTISPECIES: DUF5753 domain-containing protein [Streptomyces]|uniref:DUF5753 domain-containing protein n=1 Tax=Streptomyces TaxID=1883 RepID=UPI000FB93247|nr:MULTISPECIES: DUF5753 domain-containing protein [unclassified Streptomyces]MBQ0915690.1 DNA-binding protein [Streptomyces sp. RM99]RSS77952.1 DNA-binding protein [Streptomyces sp. WAC06128]GGY87413.1 hypothetical protein GCM10010385_42280 [Streptomyces geysiriensis]